MNTHHTKPIPMIGDARDERGYFEALVLHPDGTKTRHGFYRRQRDAANAARMAAREATVGDTRARAREDSK